jgi:hypothetical protein
MKRILLVPKRYRGDVIIQLKISPITLPAQRLNGYFQALLESHRVGDVPAIQTELLARFVFFIGS